MLEQLIIENPTVHFILCCMTLLTCSNYGEICCMILGQAKHPYQRCRRRKSRKNSNFTFNSFKSV